MPKNKKQKQIPLYHVTGWYGSVAIVSGFFLVSFGILHTGDFLYQLINLTGASGILYLSYKKNVKESLFLNSFWAVIALISMVKMLKI